jgi:hypothetical protein
MAICGLYNFIQEHEQEDIRQELSDIELEDEEEPPRDVQVKGLEIGI